MSSDRNDGYDFLCIKLEVGQLVVKVSVSSNRPHLSLKKVTRVDDSGVYLNDWHSPVQYSSRLVVVQKE
jgi:hypothetical protein